MNVLISKEHHYNLEIVFVGEDDTVIRIETGFTKEQYPPLAYLSNQQVDYITTGYRDDQDNLQPLQEYKSLENLIHLN
ncbi:hypothetical protein D3C72_2120060 [compost metagenome]